MYVPSYAQVIFGLVGSSSQLTANFPLFQIKSLSESQENYQSPKLLSRLKVAVRLLYIRVSCLRSFR